MNEQELCAKRLLDLSKQANIKGIPTFSDFLNLNELNICLNFIFTLIFDLLLTLHGNKICVDNGKSPQYTYSSLCSLL